MPINVSVQLPVATKDPREAIGECLKLIRSKAVFPGTMEINLGLHCRSNPGLLTRLAEQLPLMALGFRNNAYRLETAGEYRANPDTRYRTFDGNLTDHFLPMDALRLVENLLASPPQEIRSTTINFSVRKIQWKGSPDGWEGSLSLFDLKAFKHAARFSLSARLQIPDGNPASPEVKELLKQVSQLTGIAFDKGHVSHTLGEKGLSPEYGEAVLVGQICFDEAIETLAAQLPVHWISEFAPSALPPEEALAQRLHQWGNEGSGKVNMASVIKASIKESVPELKSVSARGDEILFRKSLGPSSDIIVIFSKAMPRIGKAFTLALGIHSVEDHMRFTADVFRFERSTEHKAWIYGNTDEARAMANEAANLAKVFLPRFESAIKSYFAVWPKELPAGIEQHGNLTAREAFEKAQSLACNQFPDAVLIRIQNHIQSLKTRDIEGPELSMDGRLRKNGAWWFHFYSEKRDVSFQVTVPFVGRIRMLDHGKQYKGENARRYLVPAGEEWMDSDRAFALAEERGGQTRRESGKIFGISTKLQMHPSFGPYWGIMYLIVDERGRNDLIINIDAVTGEALNGIRGF